MSESFKLPAQVISQLEQRLGKAFVLTHPDELLVYEADALTIHKHLPSAVVIPGTAEEVAAAVPGMTTAEGRCL